jgi:hypothetical protein
MDTDQDNCRDRQSANNTQTRLEEPYAGHLQFKTTPITLPPTPTFHTSNTPKNQCTYNTPNVTNAMHIQRTQRTLTWIRPWPLRTRPQGQRQHARHFLSAPCTAAIVRHGALRMRWKGQQVWYCQTKFHIVSEGCLVTPRTHLLPVNNRYPCRRPEFPLRRAGRGDKIAVIGLLLPRDGRDIILRLC